MRSDRPRFISWFSAIYMPPLDFCHISIFFIKHNIHTIIYYINPARLMIAKFLVKMEITFFLAI